MIPCITQIKAKPRLSLISRILSGQKILITQHVDALVILTEWNEFRALDLKRLSQQMNKTNNSQPHLIDFRNIYKEADVTPHGFQYISIGRPSVKSVA
jgi:UDP-glucose 6-dehydrogenase